MISHRNGGLELGLIEAAIDTGCASEKDFARQKHLSILPKNRTDLKAHGENYYYCHASSNLYNVFDESLITTSQFDILRLLSKSGVYPKLKIDGLRYELIYDDRKNLYVVGDDLRSALVKLFIIIFSF